nr:hypothetical protein [Escherichia coli]
MACQKSHHLPCDYSCLLYNLRAHETGRNLVCRLLLEKKKKVSATLRTDLTQPAASGRQARLRQAAAGAPASLRRTRWRGFGLSLRSDA